MALKGLNTSLFIYLFVYLFIYFFIPVTLAATAIFSYAWLVPLAMWGVLVWRGSRAKISLLELLCIYGYSLAIFVPVSVSIDKQKIEVSMRIQFKFDFVVIISSALLQFSIYDRAT